MNGCVRLKLALTERAPLIRTYDEAACVGLPDSAAPVDLCLGLLGHLLAYHAWHGRHHVAHITTLREREGW